MLNVRCSVEISCSLPASADIYSQMPEPDNMALVREYAAAHHSARHYSVISADRMIDGRMMETGFNPATFDQSGPDFVPGRMPIETTMVEETKELSLFAAGVHVSSG
jgi:hypothetical protein